MGKTPIVRQVSWVSYREMALVNIAFCHSQTGNGDQAKQYYRKALDLFPDSGLAEAGMNMILAVEKKYDQEGAPSDNVASQVHLEAEEGE